MSGDRSYIAWVCKCDCGNTVTRKPQNLCDTSSCGCGKKEMLDKLHHSNIKPPDDLSDKNKKSKWYPLYSKFKNMHTRCENPNYFEYSHYGNRGIRVCKEWDSYETFKKWALEAGYTIGVSGHTQTLDRIDVNKGYTPENCRIVDMYVQANNKTDNRVLSYQGKEMTLSQWARELGVSPATMTRRVNTFDNYEDIFQGPISPDNCNGKAIFVNYDGESISLSELARRNNIKVSTVRYRYRTGCRGKELVSKKRLKRGELLS